MLTVDFARLPISPGARVLDLGCGAGRHAFEAARRGAQVIALDADSMELGQVAAVAAAMDEAGEIPAGASIRTAAGDATAMPFEDGAFDIVIASEVMEHIRTDQAALAEVARVLRPGGTAAVTVPAWLPERICWLLSDDYHNVPGGHVRIFTQHELQTKLSRAGLLVGGHHRAHALHSPYWWVKCAVGVHDDDHPLASAYHKLLVWDIMRKPALTRLADQALNPLIGKSLVVYASKSLAPLDEAEGLATPPAGAAASTAPAGAAASTAPAGAADSTAPAGAPPSTAPDGAHAAA